jgi:hypothetical protein
MGKDEWLSLSHTKELVHQLQTDMVNIGMKCAQGLEEDEYRKHVGMYWALHLVLEEIAKRDEDDSDA